jgi:hypothetical protein
MHLMWCRFFVPAAGDSPAHVHGTRTSGFVRLSTRLCSCAYACVPTRANLLQSSHLMPPWTVRRSAGAHPRKLYVSDCDHTYDGLVPCCSYEECTLSGTNRYGGMQRCKGQQQARGSGVKQIVEHAHGSCMLGCSPVCASVAYGLTSSVCMSVEPAPDQVKSTCAFCRGNAASCFEHALALVAVHDSKSLQSPESL